MKNTITALLFFGSAVVLAYFLYERFQAGNDAEAPEDQITALTYPEDVEIVRKDGSRLDIRLTGRNASHIQFERLSDNLSFVFPIVELDTPTQQLILSYPERGFIKPETNEPEVETLESQYVEQLKNEIDKIDRKLRDLQVSYATTQSQADRRAMDQVAQKLKAERLQLSAEIAKRTGEQLERRKPDELRDKY